MNRYTHSLPHRFARLLFALLLSVLLLASLSTGQADTPAHDPHCERTAAMPAALKKGEYRGNTPACVPNGKTLDVAGLQALLADSNPDKNKRADKKTATKAQTAPPVLIDVWPIYLSVDEDFGSEWLPTEEHYSLPGAVWLPNIGYGEIKPAIERYLKRNLDTYSAGQYDTPLVFFCVSDCWMAWNAVQRVAAYGYTQVYWYKDGTDGWKKAGLELLEVEPVVFEGTGESEPSSPP